MSWISDKLPSIWSKTWRFKFTGAELFEKSQREKDKEQRRIWAEQEAMQNGETSCMNQGLYIEPKPNPPQG